MRLNWNAPPIYDAANVAVTGGNAAFSVLQGGIAFVKAPTGSMANNGAVTLGTALPVTYAEGCYMWLPTGAIVAASVAGWYWTVMSSSAVGTVFNSTYTSGLPATGVATAFATTGPGAFTGDTGSITALTFTVPALGINARYESEIGWSVNNSAGTKNLSPRYAGSNVNSTNVTTQNAILSRAFMQNRGRTDKQVVGSSTLMSVGSGGIFGQLSLDTSVAQTATVLMSATTATDYAILDNYVFQIRNP